MEAGARIAQSGVGGCTMGFHITIGTDDQFVTAGHCGYGGGTTFTMSGYGTIGSEAGTLMEPSGDDIMKAQMGDIQASDWIWGEGSRRVGGYRAPVYGEAICTSLGYSQHGSPIGIDCGTVSDDFKGYNLNGVWGSYYVFGGDAQGLSIQGGDSGSPVYVRLGTQAIAIGVVSTTGQEFALLSETLPIWGAVPF